MNFEYWGYLRVEGVFEELLSEMSKIEGCFSRRIGYFTKFKKRCYEEYIKVGVGDEIIIKIRQHDICWIECNISVEDATEITEEDLSIINDIVLFLKTKAEESLKQWKEEESLKQREEEKERANEAEK